MKRQEKLTRALTQAGAVLRRTKRHNIYHLPNGRIFVVAKTPSDRRAEDNALSLLRKLARAS